MPINNTKMKIYLKSVEGQYTIEELLNIVNNKFNKNYTKNSLRNYCNEKNIKFKYEKPLRNKKIKNKEGTEYINCEGKTFIKNKNKWVLKQRYIYEKNTNKKLTHNDCIIFLDGDKNNFDFNNLKKVNKNQTQMFNAYIGHGIKLNNKKINELLLNVCDLVFETRKVKKKYE